MALTVEEVEAILKLRDELSAKLNTAKGNLSSFSATAATVGAGLTAALTLPILGVGASAIKMAMNAEESENLFNVSFGEMADQAKQWSATTTSALVQTETEVRSNAATLFTMMESMGLSKDAAFAMSTSMVDLTGDLASFRNLSPEVAFEKLRSGITGQSEPLMALGINVQETAVKMALMKRGLIEQGEELTIQQKVMGRYLAIMDQTKKDQGDLARTQTSATNVLRNMKKEILESTEALGKALLPAFVQVLGIVKQALPYFEKAVKWFTELSPQTQKWAIAGVAVVAALGPMLVAVAGLVTVFGVIAPILPVLAGGFAAVSAAVVVLYKWVPILTDAWQKWGQTVKDIVITTFDVIKQMFVDRFLSIYEGAKKGVEKVANLFTWLKDTLVGHSTVTDTTDLVIGEFKRMGGGIEKETKKGIDKVSAQWRDYYNWIGEREMEAVADSMRAARERIQVERDMMNEIGVARMNFDAEQLERQKAALAEQAAALRSYYNEIGERRMEDEGKLLEHLKKTTISWGGFFGGIKDLFTNSSKFIGEWQDKLTSKMTGMFGGKEGGLMGSIIGGGMNLIFGPAAGLITSLMSKGLAKMGELALAGLKKIGGFFKDVFGGPSAKELAGREVVETFEANLKKMLSDTQLIEAGGESWKATVIAIRDSYIAMGRTEQEALKDAERLWAASKSGPEAVRDVINDINRKMKELPAAAAAATAAIGALNNASPSAPELPEKVETTSAMRSSGLTLMRAGGTGGAARGVAPMESVPLSGASLGALLAELRSINQQLRVMPVAVASAVVLANR